MTIFTDSTNAHRPTRTRVLIAGGLRRCTALAPLLAAVVLSVAVVSCGGEPAPPREKGTGALTRLLDVAQEVTAADRTVLRVAGIRVERKHRKNPPLIGESSNGSLVTLVFPMGQSRKTEDKLPAFVVRGEGPKTIIYPTTFDRRDITTVAAFVSCYGNGSERARAVLLSVDHEVIERTGWIEFDRRREPRILEFHLEQAKDGVSAMGGVGIEFEGRGAHGAIVALHVLNTAVGALLPEVGNGAAYVAGDESRTAAGLIEEAGWRASFETPGDSRLHLSLHWPSRVRRGGSSPTLLVHAEGPSGSVEKRIKLPKKAHERWVDIDVDLRTLGKGAATISLDLEDDGSDQTTAALLLGDVVVTSLAVSAPTVLLITSDTHRGDHLGIARTRPFVSTPTLDALARRGLYFTDCQSVTNVTNPSHIAIMTGIHPRDTQITNNTTILSAEAMTLADRFQAAGYRTFAAISTQHLGPSQSGLGQGFDRFQSTEDFKRRGEEAIEQVKTWMEEADGEPVFAWLHIFDAHAPYDPPKAAVRPYYKGNPRDKSRQMDLGGSRVPHWVKNDGITDTEYVNALYRGEIDTIDKTLDELLSLPRVRDGWIAFTADHGESLGTKGFWWDHAGLYLPNLDIPLILAGPGVAALQCEVPIQNTDIGRTLLDLAGVDVEFPGRNLVDVAAEQPGDEPRFAISSHGLQASVSSGDWFVVLDLRDYQTPKAVEPWVKGRIQIFDRRMGVDSGDDRLDDELRIATRMRARLIDWLGDGSARGLGSAADLSAHAAANIEELGYGGYTDRTESVWWSPEDVAPEWLERFE